MTTTVTWSGTLTARSAIAHGGEHRGTITLLRREVMLTPDGTPVQIPLVSGNAVRGRLRRIGEELTRDVLAYEGTLTLAAAHALRGGGSLAKVTREPLSGARLQHLRALLPQLAVFGAAAGGRVISGCLQVGRLIPHLAETEHLTGHPGPSLFAATQLETYTRVDETADAAFTAMTPTLDLAADTTHTEPETPPSVTSAGRTGPLVFSVETFPAGTRFACWVRIERATDLQVAFLTDVLDVFARHGTVGGRGSIGHGQVSVDWDRVEHPRPAAPVDWRAHLHRNRAEALTAIGQLT
jgi:hypothetical protein